jgi:N-acyl homoserine lactone hydrolase
MTRADEAPGLRLYILETGYLRGTDIPFVGPNGEVERISATWFSGCYLLHHPRGWLLWDTGLPDSLISLPNGLIEGNIQSVVTKTLASWLHDLNLTPQEINYVAFSHANPDHAGNITLFTSSTLLIHGREVEIAMTEPPPKGLPAEDRWALEQGHTLKLRGDYDVFGDGSVVILEAPGHTVGHQVLCVRLPKYGTVILCGDLYYSPRDQAERLVAEWNTNRQQTIRSMEHIEKIAGENQAKLLMHHDQEQMLALPQAPAYLE